MVFSKVLKGAALCAALLSGSAIAATIDFEDGDQYRIRGKGAGRWPTTESVMADLSDVSETTLG